VAEFAEHLRANGCALARKAEAVLGNTLFEKLRAAGIYEVSTVSNETGEHAFVTSPGAFHKFLNPFIDDSFDMAKQLVSALTYGMTLRRATHGRIWSIDRLLGALIAGRTIGPATAIGSDYRVLEQNRVVQLIPADGTLFRMRLLKREIASSRFRCLRRATPMQRQLQSHLLLRWSAIQAPRRVELRCGDSKRRPASMRCETF